MNADAGVPEAVTPEARTARADPRVAEVLYRTALTGDRWVVLTTMLGALFVASVIGQQRAYPVPWLWCAACVVLAGLRLLLFQPRLLGQRSAVAPPPPVGRWLGLLFVTSAIWGAGPPLFILADPSAGALLTGILLAVAGLSAPLVAASRSAVYLLSLIHI